MGNLAGTDTCCKFVYISVSCAKLEIQFFSHKVSSLLGYYAMLTGKKFDILLTVHLSIILVNAQLDAQFFYFIILSLQSSTCFEQRRAHHQEIKLY